LADPPKVFISYSHDSPQHEERVLGLANRLRQHGVDAQIDQYEISPAEGWPFWCERQIDRADFVLMVCTETYLRRVKAEEEGGRGLGVLWEANFIRHILYNSGSVSRKFVPILFSDGSDKNVPWMVSGFTRHQVDVDEGFSALWRQLRNEPAVKKPPIGKERPGIDAASPLPPKQPKLAAVEAARKQVEVEVEAAGTPPSQLFLGSGTLERLVQALSPLRIFRDVGEPWCPEMVAPAPGAFLMGSPESEKDRSCSEGPQHEVTIGYRFALGRYPVTFDEYDHFCAATKRKKRTDRGWGRGKRPVINVNWRDGLDYCEWLARETDQPYRLPSEAEWEYACRAGTTTRYAWGDTITSKNAAYAELNLGKTTEVGQYPANPWGLYDMHGNVWEWVEDIWHDSYQGAPSDGSAWTGGEGKQSSRDRVYRGGSWVNSPSNLRSAVRNWNHPDLRIINLGFRVARTLS
jgi:formylglycine-generating enzyme required for sulfatase activity